MCTVTSDTWQNIHLHARVQSLVHNNYDAIYIYIYAGIELCFTKIVHDAICMLKHHNNCEPSMLKMRYVQDYEELLNVVWEFSVI